MCEHHNQLCLEYPATSSPVEGEEVAGPTVSWQTTACPWIVVVIRGGQVGLGKTAAAQDLLELILEEEIVQPWIAYWNIPGVGPGV